MPLFHINRNCGSTIHAVHALSPSSAAPFRDPYDYTGLSRFLTVPLHHHAPSTSAPAWTLPVCCSVDHAETSNTDLIRNHRVVSCSRFCPHVLSFASLFGPGNRQFLLAHDPQKKKRSKTRFHGLLHFFAHGFRFREGWFRVGLVFV